LRRFSSAGDQTCKKKAIEEPKKIHKVAYRNGSSGSGSSCNVNKEKSIEDALASYLTNEAFHDVQLKGTAMSWLEPIDVDLRREAPSWNECSSGTLKNPARI
jgi:hypothetical protein